MPGAITYIFREIWWLMPSQSGKLDNNPAVLRDFNNNMVE